MRRPLWVLIVVIAFAVAVPLALAARLSRGGPLPKVGDPGTAFFEDLGRTERPIAELDLSSLYGGGPLEILLPDLGPHELPPRWTAESCSAPTLATHPAPHALEDAICASAESIASHKERELIRIFQGDPINATAFIMAPPFVDPTGRSYADVLSRSGIAPYNDPSWVRDHLIFFKPSELRSVLARFQIDDRRFAILAGATESELRALVDGAPIVLTSNELLLRDRERLGFSPLRYRAYALGSVRARLAGSDFDLVPASPDEACLRRMGNACWTYKSKTALAFVERYAAVIVALVGVLGLLLAAMVARDVFAKAREQERARRALQILAHEFRTPVSALLLLLDELGHRATAWADADQDLVTRASGEAHRLRRILEMSRGYLEAQGATFRLVTIASVNDWVQDFATETDPRVRVVPLDMDRPIEVDVFWLRFALTNLIQNAFAHGREPVIVRLEARGTRVSIIVEDQGACEFSSLRSMCEPFVKSSKSQGMGLGLGITRAVVSEWGARLDFEPKPTSFVLSVAVAGDP